MSDLTGQHKEYSERPNTVESMMQLGMLVDRNRHTLF